MADWLPTYYARTIPGLEINNATLIMGVVTVIGGIGGTLLGSVVANKLRGITRQPYLATCACGILSSTVFAGISLYSYNQYASPAMLLVCQILLWTYTGPSGAVVANCVSAGIRNRAFSFQLFFVHLGDAVSPTVVGLISDATGNITLAVTIVPVAIFFGGLVYLFGWRCVAELPEETMAGEDKFLLPQRDSLVPLEGVVDGEGVLDKGEEEKE